VIQQERPVGPLAVAFREGASSDLHLCNLLLHDK
jgi:hypothetical protein